MKLIDKNDIKLQLHLDLYQKEHIINKVCINIINYLHNSTNDITTNLRHKIFQKVYWSRYETIN